MREVHFDAGGLVPVVAQEATTGRVLMLAYMNREALARTVATGQAWYWSRSRGRLWRKGEESGHTQRVREIRIDCDGDALLLVVDQQGPACHTGHPACFFRDLDGGVREAPAADIFDTLFAVIGARAAERPAGSYTAALLAAGQEAIAAKVTEESAELIRAGRQESRQRVVEEAADLVFHTMVLLASRGVGLDEVRRELARRRRG
ncbi:MAG: bifunctional phosphoribosyl-AMP cyclohydrolase/phosphoribosyl-ATP diphosphatase HisIE [Armatimonadota bacterium]|nr:bifunctional phosphoribosyl-AMP cyclohydrolase/phosphoribosyl-ATP diphosphatase HisIE [Armatimonadota bacterium]MDR7450651.1 bifunctional phosphoribosyl-AMP cyclohydrolase/phosphoribosyl-ATP diphosphatase HisIE [Armatimonadota bacterium]MDR7466216.1 bifunctional phosphoribosyl-AMP cyclohydrolase/phosphoribosyl-ATP diphosphatase HisIE [Armatimonadota bacterium]MDR7492937.1 bifunctional phosphoribosyl-AMP cyclohydrolase/phosphoribosyl-ATP diphosphatase HisIE [Armatimonadota bacterium]MDR749830